MFDIIILGCDIQAKLMHDFRYNFTVNKQVLMVYFSTHFHICE